MKDRYNTGIYIRYNGENVLLENLPEEERTKWLSTLDTEGLVRTVNILSGVLNVYEKDKPLWVDGD